MLKIRFLYLVFLLLSFNISLAQYTAGELIFSIKQNITCEWNDETVDTFKGGKASMEITGIATTFLATLEVLKKAKENGFNMIITHEPTFYNHLDKIDLYGVDDVINEKLNYIKDNNLIVFRFHDHIHQTSPDGIYKGVVDKMDWQNYEVSKRPYIYKLPKTSLKELVIQLNNIFDIPVIRVVGDPEMILTNASLVLGASGAQRQISVLQRNDVDVEIIGETQEWETVEYVRDAVNMGKKKALIIIGHANSEEAGMKYCADWLKTFVSEVPIEFIPAGDPFWTVE